MNNKEEIENLIKETQLELSELENKQRQVLERLQQLRLKQKSLTQNSTFQSSFEPPVTNTSSQADKISLFRTLFKGREDVVPKRWKSADGKKKGYQPYCMLLKRLITVDLPWYYRKDETTLIYYIASCQIRFNMFSH